MMNDNMSQRTSCTSHTSAMSGSVRLDPELERLALELQRELKRQEVIGQHTTRMMTIPNSFTGMDAVSILRMLLPRKTSREEALERGNEIMTTFTFFKHAIKKDRPLLDSPTDFYQFESNLPSQVQKMKKKYSSYWDRARLLEKHLEIKDRKHMFRTFKNCFVAQEAIDVMMNLKLVRTRREGVHLMKRLNEKVFFCQHVCCEQEFRDDYLFFHLVAPSERMRDPHKKKDSKKSSKESKTRASRHNAVDHIPVQPSSKAEQPPKKRDSLNRADSIRSRLANHREELAAANNFAVEVFQ